MCSMTTQGFQLPLKALSVLSRCFLGALSLSLSLMSPIALSGRGSLEYLPLSLGALSLLSRAS